jgi:PAS domain-containing protein
MRDAEGRIVRWCLLLTDVEDRKRAEESLRQRERDLSMIIETMPGLVWCATANGELTHVNQRILDYIGASVEALARAGWLNFLHPDDVLPTVHAWTQAVGAMQERMRSEKKADGLLLLNQ